MGFTMDFSTEPEPYLGKIAPMAIRQQDRYSNSIGGSVLWSIKRHQVGVNTRNATFSSFLYCFASGCFS